MTAGTIIQIVIIVVILLAAAARIVDWRGLAVKWVGNNPVKAQIYIKAGHDIRSIPGVRTKMTSKAQTYRYTDVDKQVYTIVVAGDKADQPYPYEYIRGRRVIGISDGHVVASPLGFMTNAERVKYEMGLTEFSQLAEGINVVTAMRTVKKSKTPSWLTWLIIAVVVVGAYFLYSNYIAVDNVPAGPDQTEQAGQGEIPIDKLNGG